MPSENDYWCKPRPDGKWAVAKEKAEQPSGVFETQAEAWEACKDLARESRGEAFLQGEDGQIRERNTYGNDPRDVPG